MSETLDQLCNHHSTDKGSSGHGFCNRYEPLIGKWRHQPINMLEVGIQFGCSARMWLDYFTTAQVHGVDIRKDNDVSHPRFHFTIGDQNSREFWNEWKQRSPKMDFIIDDAAHFVPYSRTMLECLWEHLVPGGVYAIEDTSTHWDYGYHPTADSGEWLRHLLGEIHWHGKAYGGKPNPPPFNESDLGYFERTVDSMRVSKHLVILVKK